MVNILDYIDFNKTNRKPVLNLSYVIDEINILVYRIYLLCLSLNSKSLMSPIMIKLCIILRQFERPLS